MPANYWLKFGNTPLGYNGSGIQYTHVEQPGTLTVSLVGTGTGFDNAKNFNVLVTFGSAISYTVDGTPVATPSATCTLTLHAGQSSVIGNIPFGTTYTISENVTDEGYELVSITNSSGTMTDGGAFSSVVTNLYHAPGTLTLTKVVSGTGFDASKQFEIVATFGRAISYTVNGTPVSSPTTTYTAHLAHNQSVVLGNIPSGVSYNVVETPLSQQDIDAGYSNGLVVGGSGTMTDAGDFSATANNVYHAPGTLTLTKVVSGTGFDATKQFELVVTFGRAIPYTVNGSPVSSPSATYTAHLAHNQSVALGNIPSGVTYSVVETPLSQQDIELGYSNGSVVGGSGTMTDAGSLSATANNSYTELTTSLYVTRANTGSVGSNTLTVLLSRAVRYSIDGVKIDTPSDTATVTLTKGQSVMLTDLPVGSITLSSDHYGNFGCIWKDSTGTTNTRNFQYADNPTAEIYGYTDYTAQANVYIARD